MNQNNRRKELIVIGISNLIDPRYFLSIPAFALLLFSAIPNTAQGDWKESVKGVYNATVGLSTELFSSPQTKETIRDIKRERLDKIWDELLDKLNDAREVFDEIPNAPTDSLFGDTKESLRVDLNDMLEVVLSVLDDGSIREYRENIATLEIAIKTKQSNIQTYKENRVSAPREHLLKTTKAGYDEKIKNAKIDIQEIETEIETMTSTLGLKLQDSGIILDNDQLSVLLSRVDSEDILQMAAVYDVLKMVTDQLLQLTISSGESIDHAKKYYGMHVILLETVLYMQNKYIDKIDNKFAPKLTEIINLSNNLMAQTKAKNRSEVNSSRKAIYEKNIKAQALTIKTAGLYKDVLYGQKRKVMKGSDNTRRDLDLAINTYLTVQISSDLLDVLKDSKQGFDVLMNLQVPDIVAFENTEMQKKFQELSTELSTD